LPPSTDITDLAKRAALEAGFDLVGVAPVCDFPELESFPNWIAEDRAGDMRYLESRDEAGELKRASLSRVAPWARSVIVCARNYNAEPRSPSPVSRSSLRSSHLLRTAKARLDERGASETRNAKPETRNGSSGWISRYAWSERDYHDVLMEALRRVEERIQEAAPEAQTRCYVDTGPLIERVYARYAGLGWVGKNTCIINQKLGSWLFLGVILTSLELSPGLPAPDRCGTCTRCLDACPTGAFPAPHQLDASRCVAYLTIEKRGPVPLDLRAGIGQNVFGCDICQDVCPWNRKSPITTAPEFQARAGLVNPDLVWLATISEEDFRKRFRGSPIKRAKRTGLRRNAVIAMGNSGDRRFLPLLRELAADSDEVVAEHARWAIEVLAKAEK
jgi:epoxyqueuosine reductase